MEKSLCDTLKTALKLILEKRQTINLSQSKGKKVFYCLGNHVSMSAFLFLADPHMWDWLKNKVKRVFMVLYRCNIEAQCWIYQQTLCPSLTLSYVEAAIFAYRHIYSHVIYRLLPVISMLCNSISFKLEPSVSHSPLLHASTKIIFPNQLSENELYWAVVEKMGS